MDSHLAFTGFRDRRIHLGVTGSIAAFKALDLLRDWKRSGVQVGASLTESAQEFVTPLSFRALGADPVDTHLFPTGDNVYAHLAPGQGAHCYAIAPATANILAKLAYGLADDVVSCQALAHPGPVIVAPAMNPNMWLNPAVQENWQKLQERAMVCLAPDSGEVACGDLGTGRLARHELIFLHGLKALSPQDLAGTRILVTLGPTREYFDPVRFWSNPSSGTMGASIAVAAWLRGADVTAICGPVSLWLPPDIHRISVTSAKEMHEAATDIWPSADVAVCTAAVADFAPKPFGETKYKKTGGPLQVEFSANPDILAALSGTRHVRQRIIGFAAETGDLARLAREKRERKGMDIIVANHVLTPGAGFAAPTNEVTVIDAHGREESWPTLPKTEVAWRLLDWLSLL